MSQAAQQTSSLVNNQSNLLYPQLNNAVSCVTLGRGDGEFMLETQIISNTTDPYFSIFRNNNTQQDNVADIILTLDQLQATYPNLQRVVVPIAWYGNDLRASHCLIQPGVINLTETDLPYYWYVHGLARPEAYLVTKFNGVAAQAGTPTDNSILNLCLEINRRGLAITLSPTVLMDIPNGNSLPSPYSNQNGGVGQPAYPSKTQITLDVAQGYVGSYYGGTGATSIVNKFFGAVQASQITINLDVLGNFDTIYSGPQEWSYRRFILHYAKLANVINNAFPGLIDDFVIGTKLGGLTSVYDGVNFPAVDNLVQLASDVAAFLNLPLTYAANWDEWNNTTTPNNPIVFNMDKLWCSPNINSIGLCWNQPITDWRNVGSNLDSQVFGSFSDDYINYGIQHGENYTWKYNTYADRLSQNRTMITDANGEPWVFRNKDLYNWWANYHHNRLNGVEESNVTAWVPQSKQFRFIEMDMPAVNLATNQPDVRYDYRSAPVYPYFSLGTNDDNIQQEGLAALYTFWRIPKNNPKSNVYFSDMIDLASMTVSYWDARPAPWFPTLGVLWPDSANNQYSSNLSGRLNNNTSQYTKVVDYSDLFTDQFLSVPVWSQLADTMNGAFNPLINTPTTQLAGVRDPDVSDSYIKALNTRNMGFKIPSVGLSEDEYDRIVRNLGTFWQTCGASHQFVNFLSYISNAVLTYVPLYVNNLNINTLTPTLGGNFAWEGGTWMPTPYFDITFDAQASPGFRADIYESFVPALAPLHLVLRNFTSVITADLATIYASASFTFTGIINLPANGAVNITSGGGGNQAPLDQFTLDVNVLE